MWENIKRRVSSSTGGGIAQNSVEDDPQLEYFYIIQCSGNSSRELLLYKANQFPRDFYASSLVPSVRRAHEKMKGRWANKGANENVQIGRLVNNAACYN